MRQYLLYVVLAIFFIPLTSFGAGLQAMNADQDEENILSINEDVYVYGECPGSGGKTVRVYVVADKASWPEKAALADVSGGAESVTVPANGNIPLTRVWRSTTKEGKYDIVVDFNGNGVRDGDESCIDSTKEIGLEISKESTGSAIAYAELGRRDPGDQIINPGDGEERLMIAFEIRIRDQNDIIFKELEISTRGTGNDVSGVSRVELIYDENRNGLKDDDEEILGKEEFSKDNGSISFNFSETVKAGDRFSLAIFYTFTDDTKNGDTFQVRLEEMTARIAGTFTGTEVKYLPLDSSIAVIDKNLPINTVASAATPPPSQSSGSVPQGNGGSNTLQGENGGDSQDEEIFSFDGLSIKTRAILLLFVIVIILWIILRRGIFILR